MKTYIKRNRLLKIFKKIINIFLILICIFLFISTLIYFYISNYSKDFIYEDINKIPTNNVGLALGTSPVTIKGDASLFFISRMLATKDLIDSKKINYIIVSGDNKTVSYNEPKYMKNYLLKLNVNENAIVADYAGRRTLDSVLRSNEIFNQNKITIISQKFHNERAIFIARKNGIDAIAFNAVYPYKNNLRDLPTNIRVFLRELLARDLAILDIITNKGPEILGNDINFKNENIDGIKKLKFGK